MAYDFLKSLGWEDSLCIKVKECITTHRFRNNNRPNSIEAKILFDSDKLDVTGALGIARSLIYKGYVNEPLYVLNNGVINMGEKAEDPESFLKEYHFKLTKIYDGFYTKEALLIARERKTHMNSFVKELLDEISVFHLDNLFVDKKED